MLRVILLLSFICQLSEAVVDESSRIDCMPLLPNNQTECQRRNCVYQTLTKTAPTGTPVCYYPRESGYQGEMITPNSYYKLHPSFPNPYGNNMELTLSTSYSGNTLAVSIKAPGRYVPPVALPLGRGVSTENLLFQSDIIKGTNLFGFRIVRQSTGIAVWDTTIGGMQFADKFIQIATFLPTNKVFGFGDHVHHKLKHDLTRYTTWPMFAHDFPPDSTLNPSTMNLYGVHPFYLCLEKDGKAHGVFLLNSNAQEIVTGPGPHLTYRTIGGQLDMAFFPGPTPEEVIQQYHQYIGTPFLPAYWALGFQLSRWGYKNLDEMKKVVARVQAAGIPLDVPYADIDYMDHDLDFTEGSGWKDFPAYAQQLHNQGLHLILIFDPAVEADYDTFQRAIQQKVSFISWPSESLVPHDIQDQYPLAKNTTIMLGNVWPARNVAFPDFLDPTQATVQWWISEFARFYNTIKFDGIWIDMNEPSNSDTKVHGTEGKSDGKHLSCPIDSVNGALDNPPYPTHAAHHLIGDHLCSRTLCMIGRAIRGQHSIFDTKSLYGWAESKATSQALASVTNKRGAVISRSTFPSSGRYAGHWLGDNFSRWVDLRTSIIGVMEFNFFGIPYVGSDICGFTGVTSEELCLRWMQMGAFHPFSRNHNMEHMPAQDPAVWPSVAKASKIALTFRYQYLPYLYSLHYNVALRGGTVIRPIFFAYPKDELAIEVNEQFMWGVAFMIAPAVHEGATTVTTYFPSALWYSLIPETYGNVMEPGTRAVPAAKDSLTPVFIKGGYIVPRQAASTTTTQSRLNPFEVLIASNGIAFTSVGEMYYDRGDDLITNMAVHKRHHWQFSYSCSTQGNSVFTGFCDKCDTTLTSPTLNVIEILGVDSRPNFSSFALNGVKVNINVQASRYSAITRILYISTVGLIDLNKFTGSTQDHFTLTWTGSAV